MDPCNFSHAHLKVPPVRVLRLQYLGISDSKLFYRCAIRWFFARTKVFGDSFTLRTVKEAYACIISVKVLQHANTKAVRRGRG